MHSGPKPGDRGGGRTLLVDGVTQRFGDHLVIDDVSLEVPPGKVIGLLGPNGAGKTTLMRIVFGVLQPDRGRVYWKSQPGAEADRRTWGYMPQERGLYRDMRVLDHLVWLGRLHGLDRATASSRAENLLERLGLAPRGHDPIKNLSGGMAQRVQLAAAMVHEPELLVLDEPFAGLDPAAVEFLSAVIHHQVERGGNLVLSSHQLDLVENICESIILLHEGRVILQGGVAELKANSADRYLRVGVAVDPEWLPADAHLVGMDASGSRVGLAPTVDAGVVLDLIRARTHVSDFAVESPTLSELFLTATGQDSENTTPVSAS
ncbi:MAG: ATP-binding cassette domain-containing protein [Microthrixaceae bacterium]